MKPIPTQRLIDFFSGKELISRAELYDYFVQSEGEIKKTTLAWRIYDLKNKQIITETSRGIYSLTIKPIYEPAVGKVIADIASIFKNNYRDASYCIFDINWVNEFAVHQFSRDIVIFETEKDLIDSVSHTLADHKYLSVISSLRAQLLSYTGPVVPLIILQPIISRAPVGSVEIIEGDPVMVPTLEKMLVDVFINTNVFRFLAGAEMLRIFKYATQRYTLNFTTLLSYASRRGKRQELRDFLIENSPELKKQFLQ